jgi:hypothetical protein
LIIVLTCITARRAFTLLDTRYTLPDGKLTFSHPLEPDCYLAAMLADLAREIAGSYLADIEVRYDRKRILDRERAVAA